MVFVTHEDEFDVKLFEGLECAFDDGSQAVVPAHGIKSNLHGSCAGLQSGG